MEFGRNSGKERATVLVIEKKIGETMVTGYPRSYKLTDAFGNYSAILESELALISSKDYLRRLSDFKNYVENIEVGITVNIEEAYRENLSACPI